MAKYWLMGLKDKSENAYCITFCGENGAGTGDIELCDLLNIKIEEFDKMCSGYVRKVVYHYPKNDYRLTYFIYEKDINVVLEKLEAILTLKVLSKE